MRLTVFTFLSFLSFICAAQAQSVTDNMPPVIIEGDSAFQTPPPAPSFKDAPSVVTEPFTITDVNVDVTSDSPAHARDNALMQAQRLAYAQLCARLNAADNSAKLSDDDLAALVRSFEVQNERLSAVRYIGVFTIHFNQAAVQKKLNVPPVTVGEVKPVPQGPVSRLTVAVQTDSLAAWAQIKRRLGAVPQVAKIDTLSLGRGVSQIDLSFSGSLDELTEALTQQGFVLRSNETGAWDLIDGSMVPR